MLTYLWLVYMFGLAPQVLYACYTDEQKAVTEAAELMDFLEEGDSVKVVRVPADCPLDNATMATIWENGKRL